jgi:NAD-dependent dihydropyrimidine dehydrogenase PreA subunit
MEVEKMVSIDSAKCIGCGDCVEVCPQQCYTISAEGKSARTFGDRCMECGACKLNCRGQAIEFEAGPGCFIYIAKEVIFGKQPSAEGGPIMS